MFSAAIEQQGANNSSGWSAPKSNQASWLNNLSAPAPIFGQRRETEQEAETEDYNPEDGQLIILK